MVTDNQLLITGRTAGQIATIVGGSPCYVYARDELTERVRHLRSMMPEALKLHYAIKANPMPAVVDHMATLVDGLDIASAQELLVALSSGTVANNISFAGPAKGVDELKAAVAAGIVINVESVLELERLYRISDESGIRPQVVFRVNPDFELKSSGMKMAGGSKQFGIDAERMPDVLAQLDIGRVDCCGFHIFSGSQNLKAEALIEAQSQTFELAARLAALSPVAIKHVNIGGGLGIPYFPGEQSLNLAPIADHLHMLMDRCPDALHGVEFIMELGRYLVAEAGYYLCQVTDKKVSRGQTFLMTNGGLHHNLANSGNFGQVIRKNYPVLIANKVTAEATEKVDIVGPLCTPLNIVGAKLELPEADIGDYVVVFQAGAYGATASPQAFLSHPPVKELLM